MLLLGIAQTLRNLTGKNFEKLLTNCSRNLNSWEDQNQSNYLMNKVLDTLQGRL